MAFLGHADSAVTLRIYAHVMSHDQGERDALRALVQGVEWAPSGTSGASGSPAADVAEVPDNEESPPLR